MPSTEELKQYNQKVIAEFRANGGKVESRLPLLLLTTIGAKSSQPHTTPLAYSTDGDHLLVIAADQGAFRHPAWYHNLVKHPEVTAELGNGRVRMRAVVAEGEDRDRLFKQHAEKAPWVVEYQGRTTRQIPVVILVRVG